MADEYVDPEKALYKDLARIREFKQEVNSLSGEIGQLTKRVEKLELSDFQAQLNDLDKQVKQVSSDLLLTQQIVANLRINTDVRANVDIIEKTLRNKPNLVTQLLADAASAKSLIATSSNPYDIADEFHAKWVKVLHDFGAKLTTY